MIKQLDKYMDNLKSPYWEVFALVIFLSLVFASILTMFIASPELADKLGNTGSFLGGVIAVLAFPIGIREYLKYTRHRGFHDLNRLKNEVIPHFERQFAYNQSNILTCVINISNYNELETIKNSVSHCDFLSMKKYFIDFHFQIEVILSSVIAASPHTKKDLETLKKDFIEAILIWEQVAVFSVNILTLEGINNFNGMGFGDVKMFYCELNKSVIYTAFLNGTEGEKVFKENSENLKNILAKIKEVN